MKLNNKYNDTPLTIKTLIMQNKKIAKRTEKEYRQKTMSSRHPRTQ